MDAALRALADYTGIDDPEQPWWNLNMPKALDIMLPAIREVIAADIEAQLTWNAHPENKVAPVVNETVRRAAEIARTGRWSLPKAARG